MTPEDVSAVERSWSEIRRRRDSLLAELTRRFDAASPSPITAEVRADWLFDAVDDLVGLLSSPSRLATRGHRLGETWPDPLAAPSFALEGRAWLDAAAECIPSWSEETEIAWRQAWLLLSEVLAVGALSPFTDGPMPPERPSSSEEGPGKAHFLP